MIQVKIEDRGFDLQRLSQTLTDRNVMVANVRSINVAIRKANTQYRRLIVGQYNLRYADTSKFAISKLANYGNVTGTISGRVAPISLSRFNPTFYNTQVGSVFKLSKDKKGNNGFSLTSRSETANDVKKGVSFSIIKGQQKTLPFAFLIQSNKNAGLSMQVWARGEYEGNKFVTNKARYPLTPLKTVSPFGTMVNPSIVKSTEADASKNMQVEFERQINLLLRNIE